MKKHKIHDDKTTGTLPHVISIKFHMLYNVYIQNNKAEI